jgi:hypothetical protein
MKIARDLLAVPARLVRDPADQIECPAISGCLHLGVRQSERQEDGTRGLRRMQVDLMRLDASGCES